MAATTWYPRPNPHAGREYLLANGEVITPSELEETPSGRKVRIKGTNDSRFASGIDDLIRQDLEAQAKCRRSKVWTAVDRDHSARNRKLGFTPEQTRARFFLAKEGATPTIIWWRYAHPTLPLEAFIVVRANRYGAASVNRAQVGCAVVWPYARPSMQEAKPGPFALVPEFTQSIDGNFTDLYYQFDTPADGRWKAFADDHPNPHLDGVLRASTVLQEREAVLQLQAKVRQVDSLEKIAIPDLRGAGARTFDWLELEFVETNLNSQLMAEIVDFLDSGDVIDEIHEAVTALRAAFRRAGLVLADRDSHIMRAIEAGDDNALTFSLGEIVDEHGVPNDNGHSVSLHLPTGSLVVTCNKKVADEAAAKWEEERILAFASGQLNNFLGHTQEYFDGIHRRRTTRAIRVRRSQA